MGDVVAFSRPSIATVSDPFRRGLEAVRAMERLTVKEKVLCINFWLGLGLISESQHDALMQHYGIAGDGAIQ